MLQLISVKPANDGVKKYIATFSNSDTGRVKNIKFGAYGMSDYTIHHDDERKERYLKRHEKSESWNKPDTPGALSRWILWNKKTFGASLADYKRRFNL
jgi:hypothetical protein